MPAAGTGRGVIAVARAVGATLRPLAQLLVDAVTGRQDDDLPARVAAIDQDALLEASSLHRVTPAVDQLLRRWPEAPIGWKQPLATARHLQLIRHLRAVQDLKVIGRALDDAGIRWVAVKGPVLSAVIWPSVTMREYFDLDLIVEPSRFAEALGVVRATGAELLDRNWPLLRRTMRAELAMRARFGTPLDLHWHVAVPADLRASFRIDIGGMLGRARSVGIGGDVEVPTFDPVDTALHIAFHAAQAGANRLVWLADLRFSIDRPGFEWPEFERRARSAGVWPPIALVVDRTRRVLGLPPGAEGVDLSSGVWGEVARWRDARHPFPGLPDDPRLGGNLYSAARAGVLGSTVNLVRHNLRSRWAERRHDAGRSEGRVLRRDVPDDRARREYFELART